jgi:Ca-activated chloride channel family protein
VSLGIERLAHPEWAAACLAACAAALAAIALARLRARRRRARLLPEARPGLSLASDAALVAALCAISLALLGPRIGERVVRTTARGIDLTLLVDVSRSMDARDVPPSRLDRARRAALEVMARLAPLDRVALAAFAGRGVLLTPLTPDREALAELLAALDTGLFDPPSSDLGAGVRAALGAFEAGGERPRLLLVLSDGEDPLRRSDLGAAEALRADVRVLAVAFGSDAGATLDDGGRLLTDARGAAVVTRRRAERLERLAAATGGEVFRADRWGELDVEAALASLRRDAGRAPGESVLRRVRAARVLPFAALALALLAAEGLPWRSARAPRALRRRPRSAALLCALLALTLAGGRSEGAGAPESGEAELERRLRAQPSDPRSLIELGLARLARGRHASAERAFFAAAVAGADPRLSALAWYDLGVSALERGDLETARDAFFDALALDPSDREARFNLEWTLAALPGSAASDPAAAEPERDPAAAEPEQDAAAAEPEPPESGPSPRESGPSPRETAPEPEGAAGPRQPPLDPAQERRLLERVEDDPVHALRAAARSGAAPRGGREPAW